MCLRSALPRLDRLLQGMNWVVACMLLSRGDLPPATTAPPPTAAAEAAVVAAQESKDGPPPLSDDLSPEETVSVDMVPPRASRCEQIAAGAGVVAGLARVWLCCRALSSPAIAEGQGGWPTPWPSGQSACKTHRGTTVLDVWAGHRRECLLDARHPRGVQACDWAHPNVRVTNACTGGDSCAHEPVRK